MSTRSVEPLLVEPGQSRTLLGWICAIHGLGFLASLFNGLAVWGKSALVLITLASALTSLRKANRPPQVPRFEWKVDKGWFLSDQLGQAIPAHLLGSSRVTPWFAILHFLAEGRRVNVFLLQDSLDDETFRELRVLLTVQGAD